MERDNYEVKDELKQRDNEWRLSIVKHLDKNEGAIKGHEKEHKDDITRLYDEIKDMRKELNDLITALTTKTDTIQTSLFELKQENTEKTAKDKLDAVSVDALTQAQIQRLQNNLENITKETARKAGGDVAEEIMKKYGKIIAGACVIIAITYEGLQKVGVI